MIAPGAARRAALAAHLPLAVWTLFLTWLLLTPSSTFGAADEGIEAFEELGHGGVIAVLALLACRSARRALPGPARRAAAIGVAAAIAYAVATEALQELVPGRGWEDVDLVSSAAGAVAGGAVFLLWSRWRGL